MATDADREFRPETVSTPTVGAREQIPDRPPQPKNDRAPEREDRRSEPDRGEGR